jgi:hypothetical protein
VPVKGKGDDLLVAHVVAAAICVLIVGSGAFLLFGASRSLRGAQTQAQYLAAQQGKLLIVTEQGATCQQLSFDNRTGQIVNIQKGPCRNAGWPQASADDTPLGSIRKALNGR